MSEKRSLFEVIENGREIEKDKNLTAMEKMSEGVDKLIEMTQDAFDHIRALENALEQTDALAARVKNDLASHIHQDSANRDAVARRLADLSDHLHVIEECTILLLEQAGHEDVAESLKEQREKERKRAEREMEYPF